jgi:hypothetical protein
MDIVPIAFDSLGARSMCTFVATDDVRLIIDPGVALGPSRYGLPPHPIEYQREAELWEEIKKYAAIADVAIVTHYHYDHHNPSEPEIFKGKVLLLKHPKEKINFSQKKRSAFFLEQLKKIPKSIDFCDGKRYRFENTEIIISQPVFHGTSNKLGYVLEICIDDGKQRFLFSSDVEGPAQRDQLNFMLEFNADVVFIDGAMTYMLGYRFSTKSFEESINNLRMLIEKTNVKKLVLDHHLTRDLNWANKLKAVFEKGKQHGVEILSAAKFAGAKEILLEAMRKELYRNHPSNEISNY